MIIDFHTHLFPEKVAANAIKTLEERAKIKAYTDGTESGLYSSMCKLDSRNKPCVDISIVLPVVTNPLKTNHFNEFAQKLNEKYAKSNPKIISFAGIHPDTPDYKSVIKNIASSGFKGIKLHPDYQNTFIDDIRYEKIIEEAECYKLITVVHAGIDIGLPEPVHCPPEKAQRLIDDVHPNHLVLAHMGGWKQWNNVENYLVGQNVYFDTASTDSYLSSEQFTRIVKTHGADKILFATDSPWSGQLETISMINALPLSDEEKIMILGGNAERLLF